MPPRNYMKDLKSDQCCGSEARVGDDVIAARETRGRKREWEELRLFPQGLGVGF